MSSIELMRGFEELIEYTGNYEQLEISAKALLELDAAGALVPHGIGSFARVIIRAFIKHNAIKSTYSIAGEAMRAKAWAEEQEQAAYKRGFQAAEKMYAAERPTYAGDGRSHIISICQCPSCRAYRESHTEAPIGCDPVPLADETAPGPIKLTREEFDNLAHGAASHSAAFPFDAFAARVTELAKMNAREVLAAPQQPGPETAEELTKRLCHAWAHRHGTTPTVTPEFRDATKIIAARVTAGGAV